jgi:hypothetical protein
MSRPKSIPKKSPKLTPRSHSTRNRALHALRLMRSEHLSLAEACKRAHIKQSTFLRYVGDSVRHDRPGGRYRATPSDKHRRDLLLPTALGPAPIPIRGSKQATQVARYLNAVGVYLRKGDERQLKLFEGMKVGPRGRQLELITDPETLSSLAEDGAFNLDQLYAAFGGAA